MKTTNKPMMIQDALNAKRRELIQHIRAQTTQLSIQNVEPDPTDQVQDMNQRDQAAGIAARLSDALAQVERSLNEISGGTYGICVDCGEPIAERRLKAIPWTSHCLQCQELLESQNGLINRKAA